MQLKTILIFISEPSDEPQGFEVASFGSRWVFVRWQKPLFDGNSPIIIYKLEVKNDGGNAPYRIFNARTQENVTGLQPFTVYGFQLTALNSIGQSKPVSFQHRTDSEGMI